MTQSSVTIQPNGVVAVAGAMVFSEVSALLERSDAAFSSRQSLVFDLSAVEKTDSAGLALIIEWMKRANESGQDICFKQLPKQLLDIAGVSELEQVIPMADNEV